MGQIGTCARGLPDAGPLDSTYLFEPLVELTWNDPAVVSFLEERGLPCIGHYEHIGSDH